MKINLLFAIPICIAVLPSAVIAMVIHDSGSILFTKDEIQLLNTRIKDQDAAVANLSREVKRLKEKLKRVTDKSCL
jgi:cell division protein FtsL